jgi:outer membrane beta-barrel protein
VLVLAGALLAVGLVTGPASAQCVDEELRDQLVGRRAYRGVVPRLFEKALRHELSALAGWYGADLTSNAPVYGGAYTFHFTEELGLEASYLRTRQSSELLDAVIDRQQGAVDLVKEPAADVNIFLGHLVWSLAYGKVRWMGGGISRFDFNVALGAGATDEPAGVGVTGSGGFGMKFYVLPWLAVRLDARDHVRAQKRAQLGVEEIVNDVSVMAGASVFFPFGG